MAISETIMMWKEEDLEAGKRTRSQLIEKKLSDPTNTQESCHGP